MTAADMRPPEIPGFEYLDLLGKGGFAHVFRYRETSLGREVAVKVLNERVEQSEQASFQTEANVMARVADHPSIVSIYRADITTDGRPFLVMEYCPRGHLGKRLRSRPVPVDRALEIAIQLCGAAETAHRLGVLHRDIKPANILFTAYDRPALTDFGISVASHAAEAGEAVGMSVPWAPPEQLRSGSPMDATGDVYALAATLWTALVGRPPFFQPGGANDPAAMAVRVRGQEAPPTRREDVPASLERLLSTALAKRPDQRFPSALELARALQRVQAELHFSVTTAEVVDPTYEDEGDEEDSGTRVTGFVAVDPDGRSGPSTEPGASWPAGAGTSTPSSFVTSVPPADSRDSAPPAFTPPKGADRTATGAAASGDAGTLARMPGAGAAPPQVPGAGKQGSADQPSGDHASARGAGRSRAPVAPLLLGIGVAVVLLAAGGLGIAAAMSGAEGTRDTQESTTPTTAPAPVDPVAAGVPSPEAVTVRKRAGRLLVSWRNPDPKSGDKFAYRLLDPVETQDWAVTEETSARLPVRPGRECVQVSLVRSDGQSSRPVSACPGEAS